MKLIGRICRPNGRSAVLLYGSSVTLLLTAELFTTGISVYWLTLVTVALLFSVLSARLSRSALSLGRLYEFMARRCDLAEAKLLAKAAAARNKRSSDRYRRRAEFERKWAKKCRLAAGETSLQE